MKTPPWMKEYAEGVPDGACVLLRSDDSTLGLKLVTMLARVGKERVTVYQVPRDTELCLLRTDPKEPESPMEGGLSVN